jgi:hypothetical protein
MRQQMTGVEPGLVAYFPLDDGMGTTATNRVSGINNGPLMGGPVWDVGRTYWQAILPPQGTMVTVR